MNVNKIQELAFKALKEAVREVVKKARKENRKIAVWEKGKVKRIKP
jgi:hypothetical protein